MLSALLTVLSFFVIYLLIGVIVFGFLYVYSDTGSEWDITNIDCDEQIKGKENDYWFNCF